MVLRSRGRVAWAWLSIYVDTAHAPIKSFLPSRDKFYQAFLSLIFFFFFFFSSRVILYLFFVRDYTSERERPGDEAKPKARTY